MTTTASKSIQPTPRPYPVQVRGSDPGFPAGSMWRRPDGTVVTVDGVRWATDRWMVDYSTLGGSGTICAQLIRGWIRQVTPTRSG